MSKTIAHDLDRILDMEDYMRQTPPIEFIGDLSGVMVNGDGLKPENLLKDIQAQVSKYLELHPKTLEQKFYELCREVEKLPPSERQTNLITMLCELKKLAKWLEEDLVLPPKGW